MIGHVKKVVLGSIGISLILSPLSVHAADTATGASVPTTTLAQRIAARQTALKTKLDAAGLSRVKLKCKAAQGVIASSAAKNQPNIERRYEVYFGATQKLEGLITRLKAQNIDTVELANIETQLVAKVTQYKSDLDTYVQDLNDVAAIDCASDPLGFKTTLESTRVDKLKLLKDSADIKQLQPALIKNLNSIRVALANLVSVKAGG